MTEITGILRTPDPALANLNLEIKSFPNTYQTKVVPVLLSAKIIIKRYWKKELVPNPSKAIALIKVELQSP